MLLSVFLCPLQWSFVVATITEIPLLVILPNCLVQQKVLRPLRTQTGGTIMVGVHQPLLPYRVFDLVIQFLTFFFTASHSYLLLELIKSCYSIMKYMHDYKNRARNRLWKPKVCVCSLSRFLFVCSMVQETGLLLAFSLDYQTTAWLTVQTSFSYSLSGHFVNCYARIKPGGEKIYSPLNASTNVSLTCFPIIQLLVISPHGLSD